MEPTIKTNFHLMRVKHNKSVHFEFLNPNQWTCHQEPYQKSTSTQNQKPISAQIQNQTQQIKTPKKKSSQIHKNVKPQHKQLTLLIHDLIHLHAIATL